ncbi:hypothetical protein J3Q64DRAFT_1740019 [Phycomyces blakesleeanus]|uniref:Piwi domain-containing protein n=2 Tax=Phycomyces blakesleeanus TaxID=4837 RepID=A0A162UJJ9_PHYB8|nr:hypothetical protein PHYBLDRAFT_85795 [Phycomyces blakesleeanus NRRL 1555(-)]OAD75743.1 hypothetical protein PHYBLDRAFT_85795 [Phycomyces blakesleeanus NRRL 1555(-)]|eukprot:XP_018293783.1 hypothetical protein PHYBLDRAFT_85795 [Phycomyces blakesleeanus NRRL 1555(-)]
MVQEITTLTLRPSEGKAGRPIKVRANFFEVTSLPNQNIHHYDVRIDPILKNDKVNRKIWEALEVLEADNIFKGIKIIYDGRANAFAPKALPLGPTSLKTFEVNLGDSRNPEKSTFRVAIKHVNEINLEELARFLRGEGASTNNVLTSVMVLDVLIRHMPASLVDYTAFGRSFFIPQDKRPLPNGVETWQGYYQSARPTPGKMMLNVDVSASVFYQPGPLPDLIVKILGKRSLDELRGGLRDRDIKIIERTIKGLRLKVTHRGEQRRDYGIQRLTITPADKTMFTTEDGQEYTVAGFFQKQYNKRLAFPFLPCVVVRKDVFLPMEVCNILPGQRFRQKLNEAQTAEMIKFTCTKPHIRANKIKQGIQLLQYQANPYLQAFSVKVKPEMAIIKARVLPPPTISYHPASQEPVFAPQGGVWSLRGKKACTAASLTSWSIVNFTHQMPITVIQRFVRELCQTFSDIGMNVINRTPDIISADPQGNIERTLKEAWLKAGNQAKAQPQLIFCVMPHRGTPLYAEVKRVSDTVIGVPSQCLQSKHVSEAKKQLCANVALKVNMKLGGQNVKLAPNQIPFIAQRPTIVFGADVSHPAPGDFSRPSIAALVASMDVNAVRYASSIRIQANRTEVIADLGNMVKDMLKVFYHTCGQKPERILFYRDGISEGQFSESMNNEVNAIKAACLALDPTYNPTLTFIIVQKRHHARFFPIDQRDTEKSGNCLPGTVVDTDVVHPFEFDFYLQSHSGLQGTSRPTHYHVLKDENNFTPDALAELSYRMCYTYGRCTRAISMVTAPYYAHLLAARARFHRRNENWSDGATTESMDSEGQIASFSAVKPDLQKVMYYM